MSERKQEGIRVRVHGGDDRRLDGIVRLLEEAARDRPLPDVLGTLCGEVATITGADVVSIYVREPGAEDDVLVLSGNVGLDDGAVGKVRLKMGEGLTGFAAECMRPVSVAVAPAEGRWASVPGIGEERYPAFLAVPLSSGGLTDAVLVLQRESKSFEPAEIALATALGAAFGFALSRASQHRATGHRAARLAGNPVLEGNALGDACALPTFEGIAALESGSEATGEEPRVRLAAAFETVGRRMHRALDRIGKRADAPVEELTTTTQMLISDQRLRSEVDRECAERGIAAGLREVARRYALAPYDLPDEGGDVADWMRDRVADVEQLCLLVAAEAVGAKMPPPGSVVLLADTPGVLLALDLLSRGVSAVVTSERVDETAPAVEALWLADVPLVAEITALFTWVRPGDRVLVDGSAGTVRVDPPPREVVRLRRG